MTTVTKKELNELINSISLAKKPRKRKIKKQKPRYTQTTHGKGNSSSRIHPQPRQRPIAGVDERIFHQLYQQSTITGELTWLDQTGIENILKHYVRINSLTPYEFKLYFKNRNYEEFIVEITGEQLSYYQPFVNDYQFNTGVNLFAIGIRQRNSDGPYDMKIIQQTRFTNPLEISYL